ncbi:hypothetical protein ACFWN1_28980 [Streptomyces sp. NPDC058459]
MPPWRTPRTPPSRPGRGASGRTDLTVEVLGGGLEAYVRGLLERYGG